MSCAPADCRRPSPTWERYARSEQERPGRRGASGLPIRTSPERSPKQSTSSIGRSQPLAGFRFDPAGRFTHLFDPRTGRSPALYRTVSVIAPTATEADALSTAFSLMPAERIRSATSRPRGRACRSGWSPPAGICLSTELKPDLPVAGTGSRDQNEESATADAERENKMRGFVFVALLAVACTGDVMAQDAAPRSPTGRAGFRSREGRCSRSFWWGSPHGLS